ncbi:Mitochondrial dicarboxylate/tricarboxylate transporter DTC [Vitis vinifera]|uniref:Mitochondrial dicarboxylate/tricarboxylate transporter DTC n=1 Tax=Vitis vinifera TaxID=29760 RepID=A0A438G5H1_VITVI|nr:Mitochondrial dicarboxylate/tricarboxylate transporter DTC [Vitis vinifera]
MKHCNTLGCHGNAMEVVFLDKLDPGVQIIVLLRQCFKMRALKPSPRVVCWKALCGVTARAIGATVGSPANSSLIHEWVLALWQGIGLTAVRAMALNMEMLASYDQSVEFFQDFLGLGEASIAMGPSVVSGFFASAFSLPFDYVKTQIQKMQPNASGKYLYTSSLDYAMKTLKSGGHL